MTVRTLIFVQCLLVFALLEELVAYLSDISCNAKRDFGLVLDVSISKSVLVFGVIFIWVAVCAGSDIKRWIRRLKLSTRGDRTRLSGNIA